MERLHDSGGSFSGGPEEFHTMPSFRLGSAGRSSPAVSRGSLAIPLDGDVSSNLVVATVKDPTGVGLDMSPDDPASVPTRCRGMVHFAADAV